MAMMQVLNCSRVFPSPVGVRPLTQLQRSIIAGLKRQVSVPCWGKAINTKKQIVVNEASKKVVSVPCWGKAINTTRKECYYGTETFPSPVGVRPLTLRRWNNAFSICFARFPSPVGVRPLTHLSVLNAYKTVRSFRPLLG